MFSLFRMHRQKETEERASLLLHHFFALMKFAHLLLLCALIRVATLILNILPSDLKRISLQLYRSLAIIVEAIRHNIIIFEKNLVAMC